MHLIEAKGLRKQYHGREAVKSIDIEIKQNEILALIGTNGAGKSTTLAMLLGMLRPDSGTVTWWREDYKAHIGVQLQSTPFFEGYTAEENLRLFSALYNVKLSKEQIQGKLEECSLQDAGRTLASRLSGGQQKRLAIAVTTLHNPELIVLDEPEAELDPLARYEIRNVIQGLAKSGTTVLFSSHDMEEVSRIADRIVLMHEGRIIVQGCPKELLQQYHSENLESMYIEWINNINKEKTK